MNGYDDDTDDLLGLLLDAGDDDDDELGARRRKTRTRARRGRSMSSRGSRVRALRNQLVSSVPGVPARDKREYPLGFNVVTFVNAGVTQQQLTASPQMPFKPERLVLVVSRSSGALAEAVSLESLFVGQKNQLVSGDSLPAEAFAPDAVGMRLDLDPCTPGIDVTMDVSVSAAPGVGETIRVAPMLVGEAIG